MELIGQSALDAYLVDDSVSGLAKLGREKIGDLALTSQRWLDESPAKRLVFHRLYADLFQERRGRSVADVGGGLSAMSPLLGNAGRYVLIDPLFHEGESGVDRIREAAPTIEFLRGDWQETDPLGPLDLIIANDLFPNVDQRLGMFLEWAMPRAREVRLSLTFYNAPRWYRTRRTDADEHLCVLAFDGERTRSALSPHRDRIVDWRPELFDASSGSVFANGRQVVVATVRGSG